ncbi:MAG: ABC transporter ATP-binding protein [Lachnospiraceae bacterium]|nr:ABC transporter ATP-binding protein [Lachnospiraceae bacterium]
MIELKNISYQYPGGGNHNGVKDINLTIKDNEFVVLCGKSGCGKTTITRMINGLIPAFYEGDLEGRVKVNNLEVSKEPLSKTAELIGSVFQNPKSQFFNVDTTSELAFGCENQAMPREQIRKRVQETTALMQLEKLIGRSIFELSGGEKQQIACGSVYAAHPQILVLDEPSSNLDAAAILRLKGILQKLKSMGKTIVVSEHRLYYLMELADRFVYFADGQLLQEYTSERIKLLSERERIELGLRCISLESVNRTEKDKINQEIIENRPDRKENKSKIYIENLRCIRDRMQILNIPKLELPAGAIIAVIGENGAGKSTLAGCLCGVLKCNGNISLDNRVLKASERTKLSYMVMQDVNHQLFCDSVMSEVMMNLPEQERNHAKEVLNQMGLLEYEDTHPAALSGGQKQRVAIAAALCAHKEIFLYDEPTSGLDYEGMMRLSQLLKESAGNHTFSMVITHDMELILASCTHVLHLENGGVKEFYALDHDGYDKVRKFFIK